MVKPGEDALLEKIARLSNDKEWQNIINKMKNCLKAGMGVKNFANELGLEKGISGYIYHTVPMAIYSWLLNYGDFAKTLTDVLDCGGDTDTVGAITGALAGASVGDQGIPEEWINNILEYPRSCNVLRNVADALAIPGPRKKSREIAYFWPALIVRNVFFFIIVLGHGFLRLLPVPFRKYIIK